ncbi:MAG: HAMP domain-containing sensor histidine kinase [Rhizobiaceae bacterium]
MNRLRTILAITSVRLSIAYTLIFGLVAIIIVMYLTGSTVGIIRRQIQQSINTEMADLGATYDNSGINGLLAALQRAAAAPSANIYVVVDPSGTIIGANIRDLEAGVINRQGWTFHPFSYTRHQDRGERQYQAIALVHQLPNGMRLLVGRDLGDPERFRVVVARALFLALGSMLMVGLLTWFLIGRRALKRLDMVSASTQRIMAGDRTERLPLSGAGDEFDRLSSRLNQMLDRLNLLDQGLREVSDNIAHDLKTPLTRLRNKAERAAAAAGNGKAARQALGEVITDTDSIIRTFDALLMISRVESGSSAAELKPLDLTKIVEDAAELYTPLAEEEGFKASVEVEPGLKVTGNRELLSRSLSNLIENALKHGRSEGQAANLTIKASRSGQWIEICVADAGPGIPEKDREKVMERFTRLEKSRTVPGNGLGLSLVRAVAVLHGGKLELHDNSPGLRACLLLPVRE